MKVDVSEVDKNHTKSLRVLIEYNEANFRDYISKQCEQPVLRESESKTMDELRTFASRTLAGACLRCNVEVLAI